MLDAAKRKQALGGKYWRAQLGLTFNDALPPAERAAAIEHWKKYVVHRLYLKGVNYIEWADTPKGPVLVINCPPHGIDRAAHPIAAAWADLTFNNPDSRAVRAAHEVIARHRAVTPQGARKIVLRELQAAKRPDLWEKGKNRSGRPSV